MSIGWIDEFDELNNEKLLETVIEAADFLEDYEHETVDGIYWDIIPGKETGWNEVLTSITSLYGGTAGVALFFLRLYQVTGNERYLKKARKGIDFSFAHSEGIKAYENTGDGTLKGIPAGYFNGPTGIAYVSYYIYEESKEERYLDIVKRIAEDLQRATKADSLGICYSGTFGILSDGGLILFLIWAAEVLGEKSYLTTAIGAGLRILNLADKAESGSRWIAMDSVAFGFGNKGYFPGFFYGTAGTGYILAKLYGKTGKMAFLNGAVQAAEYIKSIAVVDEETNSALLPYNDPYKKDMYYLGVCQGPIGTSRLFYQLFLETEDQEYADWVIKLTNGILRAGAPKIHSKGYWHTYKYCCGTAGMIEHFVEIYRFTRDEKYLEAAREAAVKLIGDSVKENGKRTWYSAWNRHAPNEVECWSGLYLGSAGAASALLYFYNHLKDNRRLTGYLEDPYL